MSSQFDINKLNSFIDMASKTLSCDENCQKAQMENKLKEKYIAAESNLVLAEPQYEVAKKDYYTYISGTTHYNEIIEEEWNEKTKKIVKEMKDAYMDEMRKIKTQLNMYEGLLINFRNVVDLDEKYKKENAELMRELKKETNDVLTNDRKTYYEDQQNGNLDWYYSFFMIFYIIVVLCFGVFSFLYSSPNVTYIKKLIIFSLFVILPYLSTYILGKIIQCIYGVIGLFPTNVYGADAT
jgi:hypothetical protein